MGSVFAAYDTSLHRKVALKVVRADLTEDDSQATARLVREARAAAALTHPNIVAIFDAGDVDGTPFIAMELVEGRSLRTLVGNPDVPLADKLRWITDVARALAAAHARGLVHRDIKPSNVLVRDDGVVKVVDFGVARRATRESQPPSSHETDWPTLTEKGALVGTPQYMAPEQLRGEPADGRSDQFAWGVLAYQLLTGELPWQGGKSSSDVIAAILLQRPVPLEGRVPGLPQNVATTISRALEKEPGQRFRSMREIVAALEEAAPTRVDRAARPSAREGPEATLTKQTLSVTSPPPRPTRRPQLAVAAAVCALGIALVFTLRRHEAPLPSRDAGPRVVPVTELPVPTAGKPEAIVEFRAGMQSFRDGAYAMSIRHFRDAAAMDPTLAAAQLRYAIFTFFASASKAREHFSLAVEHRDSLSEHDQVLLDAYDPYIRTEPPDIAERDRRLKAATERYPFDADFALYYARARDEYRELAPFDRVIQLDPQFGLGYAFKLQTLTYMGDVDGALATFDRCMRNAPSAMFCVSQKAGLDTEIGHCKELVEDGRQLIAHEPSLEYGYYRLAQGSVAVGEPLETARQAVQLAWSRESIVATEPASAEDRFVLDALAGDFATAERDARELERLLSDDPNRASHAGVARDLVRVYRETGRDALAVKVADDFLRRKDAWVADPRREDFAIAHDATVEMLSHLTRAGKLSREELDRRRSAWVEAWKGQTYPVYVPFLWIHGYAAVAETAEEARAALEALPGFQPLPRIAPETLADGHVGRVQLLAGNLDEAIALLQRATSSCLAFQLPFEHTHALLHLGEALERKGDTAGACAAYGAVLERWGGATPRSITADAARRAVRALGCPTAGPAAPPRATAHARSVDAGAGWSLDANGMSIKLTPGGGVVVTPSK